MIDKNKILDNIFANLNEDVLLEYFYDEMDVGFNFLTDNIKIIIGLYGLNDILLNTMFRACFVLLIFNHKNDFYKKFELLFNEYKFFIDVQENTGDVHHFANEITGSKMSMELFTNYAKRKKLHEKSNRRTGII